MSVAEDCPSPNTSLARVTRHEFSAPLHRDRDNEEQTPSPFLQRVAGALRNWWRIALPSGVALGVAGSIFAYATFAPVYEATAWLKIMSQPQYVMFEEEESDREATRYIATQVQLIRSPMVVAPVVAEPEIASLKEVQSEEDPIPWLSKKLSISQMGDSELFRISVQSGDANAAASIVNAVAKSYLSFRSKQETETKRRVLTLLEREKNKHVTEIRRIRQNLLDLSKQAQGTGIASYVESSGNENAMNSILITNLVRASLEQMQVDAELEEVRSEAPTSLSQLDKSQISQSIASHPQLVELHRSIQLEQEQLDARQLRLKYPQNDPIVKGLSKSIAAKTRQWERARTQLQGALAQQVLQQKKAELDTRLSALESSKKKTESQLALLQASISQGEAFEARASDAMEIELRKAELASTEDMQSEISNRITELQVESQAVDRVQLLKQAEPNFMPVETVPLKKLAAISMAGLLAPFFIAIACEQFMKRVCDPQYIETRVPLSVLGEITTLPTSSNHSERRLAEQTQMFEESVNSLSTNLCLGQTTHSARTIAVASAVKHEGKSTLASQIALSLASSMNRKTLLVDADMRSPSLHRLFDLPLSPGLAEVLAGECDLQEALALTEEEGLWLLPAGRLRTNPLRLLRNLKSDVLDKCRDAYQNVVLDTPPVLAASESLLLAKAADATLLCALRDVSRENQLREAHRRLVGADANPVGIALNGVPFKSYLRKYGFYGAEEFVVEEIGALDDYSDPYADDEA